MQRIDLHVHTRLSKGFEFEEESVSRLKELAARRGLTGFALTEHIHAVDFWSMYDWLSAHYPYQDGCYELEDGFRVLSGYEVTVAERVDFVVIGEVEELRALDDAFPRRLSEWYAAPGIDFLENARRRDVIVIAAHPFREGKELAKLPLEEVFSRVDAIEVNGSDHGTEAAVASLARRWEKPLSGGSDAHYYLQVGTRSTIVPSQTLSLDNLRTALEHRRTRVSCKSYAPAVVELCREIKRSVKLRREQLAAAVPA